jgi:hypothetical protein
MRDDGGWHGALRLSHEMAEIGFAAGIISQGKYDHCLFPQSRRKACQTGCLKICAAGWLEFRELMMSGP